MAEVLPFADQSFGALPPPLNPDGGLSLHLQRETPVGWVSNRGPRTHSIKSRVDVMAKGYGNSQYELDPKEDPQRSIISTVTMLRPTVKSDARSTGLVGVMKP
jgi:hypothetical protein